jgi:hypothetical protein
MNVKITCNPPLASTSLFLQIKSVPLPKLGVERVIEAGWVAKKTILSFSLRSSIFSVRVLWSYLSLKFLDYLNYSSFYSF